jgi:hypothetical protein
MSYVVFMVSGVSRWIADILIMLLLTRTNTYWVLALSNKSRERVRLPAQGWLSDLLGVSGVPWIKLPQGPA